MSAQQAMSALGVANEQRRTLSLLKREIASGELSFVEACVDPRASAMLVWDLLMTRHGCGERKATGAMREMGLINPRKRMRDLTKAQLERMVAL